MKKVLIFLLLLTGLASAQNQSTVCAVYFTGIGCPHCAKSDPIVLGELPVEFNGSFVVIEYEIYRQSLNAQVMYQYNSEYDTSLGVPQIVMEGGCTVGDKPILKNIKECVNDRLINGSPCALLEGYTPFNELDLNDMPGRPNIWAGDRILMKTGDGSTLDDVLKEILTTKNIRSTIENISNAELIEAEFVPLSGSSVKFNKAAKLDGWIIEWNDGGINGSKDSGDRIGDRWIWYYFERLSQIIMGLGVVLLILLLLSKKKTRGERK